MNKYHIIVDFSYLYYKYYFRLHADKIKSGRVFALTSLSTVIDGVEVDTTYLYHISREIESFRDQVYALNNGDAEITMSICFDSPSERKDMDSDYKSNRSHTFEQADFDNMQRIRDTYREIGYNVYKEDGKEADDLVYSLVQQYKNDYDLTIIYTPDKDLMINICNNVGVMRSSTMKSEYDAVHNKNYERYLSAKFKCRVPYNSILLYLSTVGDTSDEVKGIKGFGPAAFTKLIDKMDADRFPFETLSDPEIVESALRKYESFYRGKNQDALDQALVALSLVKPRGIENIAHPVKIDTMESRNKAYGKYEMNSLLNRR